MAKRVRISDDDGSNWYTLPANTAEISTEAGEIDDTVFGQDFTSSQTGLIGWTVSSNGLYKGFAGYVATLYKSGSSTVITDEPMVQIGTSKTYQITDTAKNLLNRAVAVVVEDGGSGVDAANIENIDFLFGRVTFISSYTPSGVITFTGAYFPKLSVGCVNAFTLTQTANMNDNTCMDDAKANNGHRTFEAGLKTVSLDLTGIYKASADFRGLLTSRTELMIEICPDGSNKSRARGFFKPMNTGQSGDVGDLEGATITFSLSVPDDERIPYPFHWLHDSTTTLNLSIQKALDAWLAGDIIKVAYLPDGTTGLQGDALITDITLAGGLEVMNEFTLNLQGTDEMAAYP